MQRDVIVILGKAGTGKDSLAKTLVHMYPDNFNLVVTATTRPKRDYEIDGVDYIFMTDEEFKQAEKIEEAEFNGWHYGTPLSALSENSCNVIVLNPEGYMSLLDNPKINIIGTFELQVNDKQRLLRQLNREENPNVDEIIRRYKTDNNDFQEFSYAKNYLQLNVEILQNEILDDLKTNCKYIWSKLDN